MGRFDGGGAGEVHHSELLRAGSEHGFKMKKEHRQECLWHREWR